MTKAAPPLPETPSVEPAPKPAKPKKPRRKAPSKAQKAKDAAKANPWPDDQQTHPEGDIEPGSEPLPNPKHERFAQNIAAGMALQDAYRDAGYPGVAGNGRRLRNEDAVWLRIEWLKKEIGKRVIEATVALQVEKIKLSTYTRDDALREADDAMRLAMSLGQSGQAVLAVRLKCQIAGVPLEAHPTAPPDGENDARTAEDPAVVEAFARMGTSRMKLLAHLLPPPAKGTKVSQKTGAQ